MKTIGILGIQGAIEEHEASVRRLGFASIRVKSATDLTQIDGIILPGGESSSMGKQLEWSGLMEPLRKAISQGLPTFGTCAGMILLAKEIEGSNQPRIGLMDMEVRRNAYGSQLDSFVTWLKVEGLTNEIPAVFIRAPRIERCSPDVKVLASYESHPVLVRQNHLLAASFHPELTESTELHSYFGKMI